MDLPATAQQTFSQQPVLSIFSVKSEKEVMRLTDDVGGMISSDPSNV